MSELKNFQIDKNKKAVEVLEILIKKSLDLRASDLHIDPLKDGVRLRLRVDGSLHDFSHLEKQIYSELISRIKILAMLPIDEHSKPQDGRFRLNISPSEFVDVRVSILPTYYGENAVLRFLSQNNKELLNLDNLGFTESDLKKIKKSISKKSGMVLITGPTGSGKTTTLYSLIKYLNKVDSSLITIEEPIEYSIEGVRQIQVNPKSNLTFANGLRSVLRQDPDIIMVGEIRDCETAVLSVNAALTGHLVLSTLHTNDASSSLPRLLDLGVEPFLLASTFSISINQRLVKRICFDCKTETKLDDTELKYLSEIVEEDLSSWKFFKGLGCFSCNDTGYLGRITVSEIITVDDELRNSILDKKPSGEIRKIALKNGMTNLLKNGIYKAKEGFTTIEELFNVFYE